LEEAKKQKEKAKAIQAASSSSNLLKKPVQFAKPADVAHGSNFVKPKPVYGLNNAKVLGGGAAGSTKMLPVMNDSWSLYSLEIFFNHA